MHYLFIYLFINWLINSFIYLIIYLFIYFWYLYRETHSPICGLSWGPDWNKFCKRYNNYVIFVFPTGLIIGCLFESMLNTKKNIPSTYACFIMVHMIEHIS